MKNLTLITLAALSFTLFSCSETTIEMDVDITQTTDFSGTYVTMVNCTGGEEANGEELNMVITKMDDQAYLIDMGDGLIVEGTQDADKLEVPTQTINEDADFDKVTITGTITLLSSDELSYNFSFEVDDEGQNDCDLTLTRQ